MSQSPISHGRAALIPGRPQGVVTVEYALALSLFLMLFIGAIEVSRIMWLWHAASEATRLGARLAVVCDKDDADIAARMKASFGLGDTTKLTPVIRYGPDTCTASTCETVTVSLTAVAIDTGIPFVNFAPTLPPFRTTLTRESMSSADNAVCDAPA